MKKHILAFVSCLFLSAAWLSAQEIPLWPNGAPGSQNDTNADAMRIYAPTGDHVLTWVHEPSITAFLPSHRKATGAAVLVVPGGGHREIWVDHEGYRVAEWLRDHGVAAFVLKYRLAMATNSPYTVDRDELGDLQRALRLVRSRAGEWKLDPQRLGVIGFSAGGELAFLSGMHADDGATTAADPVERQSCRPAFEGLMYPGNLQRIEITTNTPPSFLVCGANDRPGISETLPKVYLQMKADKVPVELHIYAGVGHGFGIRSTNTGAVAHWPELFDDWLGQGGFLK